MWCARYILTSILLFHFSIYLFVLHQSLSNSPILIHSLSLNLFNTLFPPYEYTILLVTCNKIFLYIVEHIRLQNHNIFSFEQRFYTCIRAPEHSSMYFPNNQSSKPQTYACPRPTNLLLQLKPLFKFFLSLFSVVHLSFTFRVSCSLMFLRKLEEKSLSLSFG